MKGMSPIVQNMTSLVTGFVMVFGLYVAVTGHSGPGGGFAGALIITAGVIMVMLAFGGDATSELTAEWRCQLGQGLGALVLLTLGLAGLKFGAFFANLLPYPGQLQNFMLICDLTITAQVATGLAGIFLAMVVATRRAMPKEL